MTRSEIFPLNSTYPQKYLQQIAFRISRLANICFDIWKQFCLARTELFAGFLLWKTQTLVSDLDYLQRDASRKLALATNALVVYSCTCSLFSWGEVPMDISVDLSLFSRYLFYSKHQFYYNRSPLNIPCRLCFIQLQLEFMECLVRVGTN